MATLELVHEIPVYPRYSTAAMFAPDGKRVLVSGFNGAITVLDTSTWQAVGTVDGHTQSVNAMVLSPGRETMATTSTDKTVRLWSWPGATPQQTLTGHKNTVTAVAWSPEGDVLASASYDATVRLWPATGSGDAKVLKGHPKNVSTVLFTPDGQRLLSAGLGADIVVWNVATAKEETRFPAHREAVGNLLTLPGGRSVLSLGYDGTLRVWAMGSWQLERTVDVRNRPLFMCALSPDGSYLATTMDFGVCLFDARTFDEMAFVPLKNKGNYAVAVAPDGKTLATTAADGKLRVWKVG